MCAETSQTVARLCTAYMPPLAYFAAMVKAGRFCVDGRETFAKQTFRNRTVIITSQGPLTLSVPCVKPSGNHTPTSEVRISTAENWQRDHWRSIVTAYNKSPYFLYYRDEIEKFYTLPLTAADGEPLRLVDYNTQILDFFIKKLKLSVERVPLLYGVRASSPVPLNFTPKAEPLFEIRPYMQTFPSSYPLGHVSVLDLLFNCGPEAASYLQSATIR